MRAVARRRAPVSAVLRRAALGSALLLIPALGEGSAAADRGASTAVTSNVWVPPYWPTGFPGSDGTGFSTPSYSPEHDDWMWPMGGFYGARSFDVPCQSFSGWGTSTMTFRDGRTAAGTFPGFASTDGSEQFLILQVPAGGSAQGEIFVACEDGVVGSRPWGANGPERGGATGQCREARDAGRTAQRSQCPEPPPPPRSRLMSDAAKDDVTGQFWGAAAIGAVSCIGSGVLMAVGVAFPVSAPGALPAAGVLVKACLASTGTATVLGSLILFVDPPDRSYDRIALPARVRPVAVGRTACPHRLPAAACATLRRALRRWTRALERSSAVTLSMGIAGNRMITAMQDAGTATPDTRPRVQSHQALQIAAYRVLAHELATAVRRQSRAGRRLARIWRRHGIAPTIRASDWRLARSALAESVPKAVARRLRRKRLDPAAALPLMSRLPERAPNLAALISRRARVSGLDAEYRALTAYELRLIVDATSRSAPGRERRRLSRISRELAKLEVTCKRAARRRAFANARRRASRLESPRTRLVRIAFKPVASSFRSTAVPGCER